MSSEHTSTSGRRSSRRGGRRPSRPYSGSRNRQDSTPAKPEKKSLWQKIAAFFSGGGATETKSAPARSHSASSSSEAAPRRTERSDRPERSDRSERAERPAGFRKPEIIEVSSPRIYVGNLSFDASESDLSELFNGVGVVQTVEVVSNKHTQKSKGFAFVQMQSVDEAKRAVAELHDKEYMGRKLVVSGAKAVEEKRSERQRQPDQSEQPEQ